MAKWPYILVILLTGCSLSIFGNPEYEAMFDVKKMLDRNFTYVSDREKWGMEQYAEPAPDASKPFSGDCEEYAGAAFIKLLEQRQRPSMNVVKTRNNVLHMLACTPNYCIDNLQSRPFTRDEAHKLYNWSSEHGTRTDRPGKP